MHDVITKNRILKFYYNMNSLLCHCDIFKYFYFQILKLIQIFYKSNFQIASPVIMYHTVIQ